MTTDRVEHKLFPSLELSVAAKADLQALVLSFVNEHLPHFTEYTADQSRRVNSSRWKLLKTRDAVRVYAERPTRHSTPNSVLDADISEPQLPVLLCEGAIPGKLEDVMFGVMSPTLELIRVNSTYVDGVSNAAVLSSIVEPTADEPLQSLVLKWTQIQLPLHSTTWVKNRDFVYMEATGLFVLEDGQRIGYNVLHSIDVAEVPRLPNRVRGRCHVCAFYRQDHDLSVETYATSINDPGGSVLTSLMLQPLSSLLLSCTQLAHCGEMKKLAWIMRLRNEQKGRRGVRRDDDKCVSCAQPVGHSRMGQLSSTRGSCKLCFHAVCRSCRVRKRLTFLQPDFKLDKRKVTFCSGCIKAALETSALQVAREQLLAHAVPDRRSYSFTSSSDE
ncbi:unnamed protein product [Hyaloperonospora brassicae]|uniref:FYVE-type domain-containing protein n=1 Tax=Hyaloperonospora brassicae TaxID=162125 RepID=A0AAV0U495_HYABA|nr:unnamed protein product [Hyaloperonospora brassicae]